jgi:hypothetical protein
MGGPRLHARTDQHGSFDDDGREGAGSLALTATNAQVAVAERHPTPGVHRERPGWTPHDALLTTGAAVREDLYGGSFADGDDATGEGLGHRDSFVFRRNFDCARGLVAMADQLAAWIAT